MLPAPKAGGRNVWRQPQQSAEVHVAGTEPAKPTTQRSRGCSGEGERATRATRLQSVASVAISHFQKRIVAAVRTLQVYDVSGFIEKHPGGARQLLLGAGKDITMVFESYHHFNNSK